MPSITQDLRHLLAEQLRLADEQDRAITQMVSHGEGLIDVPTVGKTVSSAYEQLRNAAEYSEEHLLLQRAIKRFYRLNVFTARRSTKQLNLELVSELVLAGYLANGSVTKQAVTYLDELLGAYLAAHESLTAAMGKHHEKATEWVLACLSSEVEGLLKPHHRRQALVAVAYQHFLRSLDKTRLEGMPDYEGYELCLYIAVQQALLKSDTDNVRADVRAMYAVLPSATERFRALNEQTDHYYSSPLTARLRRIVNRDAAPLRILKGMIMSRPDLPELLSNKQTFLGAFEQQVALENANMQKRLDTGLAKSVAFLVITKTVVGIAIEIPFDLHFHGKIAWLPLIINLLFPPVYMALLRLGITMPRPSNTQKLMEAIENMLYTTEPHLTVIPKVKKLTPLSQIIYNLLFSIPVALTVALLYALHFNIVQMVIFFIFFSTASSLGFRLRSMVAELEVSRQGSGLIASVRDYLYLPFIVIGQRISTEYRRLNIIGRLLDIIIELPLKTFFRLARQWMRFLDEQHEQLY